MLKALALLACAALPSPAAEAPGIRQPDALRLQSLDASLGSALRQAFAAGDGAALAVVGEALTGVPLTGAEVAPEGDWSCRTIKLGGGVAVVAYGAFHCRIEKTATGRWTLTKTSGSQRLTGELTYLEGLEVRFLGVGHVGESPATGYADLPPDDQTPVEPNQTHTVAGLLEQMSPTRARLLLPAPILESDFDILYLTR